LEKSSFWDSYLSSSVSDVLLKDRYCRWEKSFSDHKEIISKLIGSLNPASIAILGSGFLNDVPLADLIDENRKVYLVDWIKDISEMGVNGSIIEKKGNRYSCLFCLNGAGKKYCKNYVDVVSEDEVCVGFESDEKTFCVCKNYDPATEPSFLKADITGGVSRSFAEKIEKNIISCKTPKAAFLKAIAFVDRYKYKPIPIPNNSIDLVTSSMVLSQFDVEPYTYFSRLLEKRFGREELKKHESKLMPLMEKLRTKLFCVQVECHIKEMHRIAKKNESSRAYLSAELFRSYSDRDHYFPVQDMPKAIEVIGKYFHFNFGDLLGEKVLRKSNSGDGVSINQSFVLIPKERL
jgi:hypothetical protein